MVKKKKKKRKANLGIRANETDNKSKLLFLVEKQNLSKHYLSFKAQLKSHLPINFFLIALKHSDPSFISHV